MNIGNVKLILVVIGENLITTAQEQALVTNALKYHIHKTSITPKCWLHVGNYENTTYLVSDCKIRGVMIRNVFTSISYCQKYGYQVAKYWHQQVLCRTNEEFGKPTMSWVYDFQTDNIIHHRFILLY